MISAEAFDAYNNAVADMSDGLSEQCAARVLAFCETHPDATVAEIREFAIEVMDGFVQVAGEAAATLAAEWYDARMGEEGLALPAAITAVVYSLDKIEDVARYQARKLVRGDMEGFAERCGEYVRNEALASLNETIIANVARDAPKGVRYARVTTGRSDCAFCLMLESRGAVYHSRKTAGEMKRYHRGCDCKVVPGVADDEFAILVEGHDPREAYDRWQELEKEAEAAREEKRRRKPYREKLKKEGAAEDSSASRASSCLMRYEGDFDGATKSIREAYIGATGPLFKVFAGRTGAALEIQGDFSCLDARQHAAVYSGLEHACNVLGYNPENIKLVSAETLESAYAQARRRSDGVTVHLDARKLARLSEDEIEQILFHEIGHGKEYEGLTDSQFAKEVARLMKFQTGAAAKLPASAASKRLEKCLVNAGVSVMYIPFYAKVEFIGDDKAIVEQLPEYARTWADRGTQDSELIAEALRFVANNGHGKNRVADAIMAEFGGNQ